MSFDYRYVDYLDVVLT